MSPVPVDAIDQLAQVDALSPNRLALAAALELAYARGRAIREQREALQRRVSWLDFTRRVNLTPPAEVEGGEG